MTQTEQLEELERRISAKMQTAEDHGMAYLREAMEVGDLLAEAKALMPNGEWQRWASDRWSWRRINRYMKMARRREHFELHGIETWDAALDDIKEDEREERHEAKSKQRAEEAVKEDGEHSAPVKASQVVPKSPPQPEPSKKEAPADPGPSVIEQVLAKKKQVIDTVVQPAEGRLMVFMDRDLLLEYRSRTVALQMTLKDATTDAVKLWLEWTADMKAGL
jgi:hypothetical protein